MKIKTGNAMILGAVLAAAGACGDDEGDGGTAGGGDSSSPGEDGENGGEPSGETRASNFYGLFPGEAVSLWPPYTIERIARDDSNTLPVLDFQHGDEVISDAYYFWDFWPLRNRDGSIAVLDGRVVILGLSAPREGNIPGERHAIARWRYFYSDGEDWVDGGLVFPEGSAVGGRQWAGSAVYEQENERVDFYYTALGELEPLPDGSDSPTNAADGFEDASRTGPTIVRQQIVQTSANLVRSADKIWFMNFDEHEVILDADGEFYATAEQARDTGALYVFRDPWYFEDPQSERRFLLFSGAAGFQTGPKSGVVGLAAYDPQTDEWQLLAPIVAAMDTNSQLERPHLIYEDGRYRLFFSSHEFTFAEGIAKPEGLYGFYSTNLWGHYLPLNEGGLVLANPAEAPLQTYSYTVLPGGLVTSFVNYVNLGDVTLSGISEQTRQWQRERFGGTPAEPFYLQIGSRETELLEMPPADLPRGVAQLARTLGDDG